MSFIGRNIKKIRTVKKLSQAAFAQLFNLARPSVGAYEEGRSEPKLDTIIQIANYFGLSVDVLLTKELTINDLYKFNVHLDKLKDRKGAQNTDIVPVMRLVPVSKQIEYTLQYRNADFIKALPGLNIPGYSQGEYRAFELEGESMNRGQIGFTHGDILICRKSKLDNFAEADGKCVVLLANNQINIRNALVENENVRLSAIQSGYDELIIGHKEIVELWVVEAYISKLIPHQQENNDRLAQLELRVKNIETQLKAIKG